ncbi:sugar MFS transporter [Alteromonas lipolytica]|uniref:Glucose/galactose MFS transporter n=1 Tax=Alteromonas lipolytica TaxID=1856405 RepID=A0A1E8FJA2_9ALTE|nr:sugar MFS transporter [Alteromonas lipolytica]OFI36010.1 glucose/galactose MFS transporter [Alteromonas lipolytica]GGF71692.1 glucose/galactose MFS transporter [Alteromonas lipolytica]
MAIQMPGASAGQSGSNEGYRFALGALTSLFFMWGFITCLNDILIPYLKGLFDLNYTEAMLIQFCFFAAYFVMSVPAGNLVHRIGHQKGLVTGLSVAGAGCALFYPAAELHYYPFFLLALFVLASGITVLQVAANPYVAALGSAQTAPARLTLTQGFNSLGTTVAPLIGGAVILAAVSQATTQAEKTASVQLPYLVLAAALFGLAVIFALLKLPAIHDQDSATTADVKPVLTEYRHLIFGAVGIFVYVGGEVAIGSFLVNFIGHEDILGLAEHEAANYVAYYWGGAMVGRFIGAAVMTKFSPSKVLGWHAVAAAILVLTAIFTTGQVAMLAILAVGLCNSIMFPTIFSLAIQGMGVYASKGAGLLCLAIVGGAIVPLLQGVLADMVGIQLAFVVPVLCYGYIMYYGFAFTKLYRVPAE